MAKIEKKDKKSTTELTVEYIKEHPNIKSCLRKDIINYSALARLISKELKIEKKTSKEAILVAARRYQEKLKKELVHEKKIKDILKQSEIEIKNKIAVFVIRKDADLHIIESLQKKIKVESGTFSLIEGSNNYTLIFPEKFIKQVEAKLKTKVLNKNHDLALLYLKSPQVIESTKGVIAFLASLFAENDVNIVEFSSCWTDTLFIINSDDLSKTIEFLKF